MSAIHFWRYTLRSISALNPVSARTEHEGALLRVGEGYGCLHPWPELGDAKLSEQLDLLASGRSTPLIDQALRCAEKDGAARRAGSSLFSNPVPESHWLAMPGDDPETAMAEGFDCVKLKIGRDPKTEIERSGKWAEAGFRLRFDGNEKFSPLDFLRFWESLGDLRRRVDLVEDPIPWDLETWAQLGELGVPLAVDRESESRFREGNIAVIKPALSDWVPPGQSRFLVTSYMDHALGQIRAAAEASRLAAGPDAGRLLKCGLMTHRCFESDPFFERIRCVGSRLQSPGGTGLGFDDLLEDLPWKRLN